MTRTNFTTVWEREGFTDQLISVNGTSPTIICEWHPRLRQTWFGLSPPRCSRLCCRRHGGTTVASHRRKANANMCLSQNNSVGIEPIWLLWCWCCSFGVERIDSFARRPNVAIVHTDQQLRPDVWLTATNVQLSCLPPETRINCCLLGLTSDGLVMGTLVHAWVNECLHTVWHCWFLMHWRWDVARECHKLHIRSTSHQPQPIAVRSWKLRLWASIFSTFADTCGCYHNALLNLFVSQPRPSLLCSREPRSYTCGRGPLPYASKRTTAAVSQGRHLLVVTEFELPEPMPCTSESNGPTADNYASFFAPTLYLGGSQRARTQSLLSNHYNHSATQPAATSKSLSITL